MRFNDEKKFEMYVLNENVFIVQGVKKSCIYDLSQNKLFSINNNSFQLIDKVTNKKNIEISIEEEEFIFALIKKNILKKSSTENNTSIYDVKEKSVISWAWIELTNRCNQKCIHCYLEGKPSNNNEISLNEFKYIVDQLVENKIKQIQLIGGKPTLLGNKFLKMLDYCNEKFDFVEIYSNATLLSDLMIERIKSYNMKIAISLHSYIEKEHDKMVGMKGSFKSICDTIKKLKKANIQHRIAAIQINNISIGESQDEAIKIDSTDFVRISGRANLKLYNNEMLKLKFITKKSFANPINSKRVYNSVVGHPCFMNKLYIDCELNVYPCVMERVFIHGNLKDTTIDSVINNNITSLSKDYINECKDCEYRYACFDCRPDRIGNNKYAKPWYCTYDVYKGEWQNVDSFINNLNN